MNAVFERDYFGFSSSKRVLWLRFGFAAGLGVLLIGKLWSAHTTSSFGDVGQEVLAAAVGLGAGLLLLTTPGAYATVLVHARASNALTVLLSTPLTPFKIAWGAFLSRAAVLGLFIMALWPPIAMGMMYGGLRGMQLFEATAAVLGGTLLLAAPAFVISAFARRTGSAVVLAYLIGASLLTALWLVGGYFTAGGNVWLGAAISPYHAVRASLTAIDPRALLTGSGGSGAYVLLGWSLLAAVLAMVIAAWRLEREGTGTIAMPRGPLFGTLRCRPLRHENPVLDHELRIGGLGSRSAASRGLLALLVASEVMFFVGIEYFVAPTRWSWHFGTLAFQMGLLVLAVTAAGATAFAAERESRMMDLIRVTGLTPAQIVVGKLAGIARTLLPCFLVPMFHLAYASYLGVFHWLAVPLVALTATVASATWAICGMAQSLDQGLPQRAVMRTMGLMGIFGLLTSAMLGVPMMKILEGMKHDPGVAASVGFGANPIAAALIPATALRTGGSDDTYSQAVIPVPGLEDGVLAILGGGAWLLVYAVVGYGLYRRLFTMYKTRFDS